MGVPGRKSWTEELKLAQRYADLTEPAFKVLKEMLESEDKVDRKWAVEQLGKAFIKMIPQDITTGGEQLPPLLVKIIDHGDVDTEGVSETPG